jgi:hypothetical protein
MYVAPLDVTTYHDVRVFVSTMTQHSSTGILRCIDKYVSSNFGAVQRCKVHISTLSFTMTLRGCLTIVGLLLASSFALVSGSITEGWRLRKGAHA